MKNRNPKFHILSSVILFVAILSLIFLLWRGLGFDPKKIPSELIGKKASDFHASWIQGNELVSNANSQVLQLSDFAGKTLVLNFWASWCLSCRQEAQELESFWQKHRGNNVVVVGIAIQDEKQAALAFAKQFNKNYILGLDDTGKIAIDYGVTGVPETFIIDKTGTIVHKEVGPVTLDLLETVIKGENKS